MKTFIFIICILTASGYSAQDNQNQPVDVSQIKTEADLLDFYRQYSSFTDPGDYAYMYETLPDSLPELCRLLKSQYIHPYAELPKYKEQIPKERWNEMPKYTTVQSQLQGFLSYDSRGFVNDRKPEHRLVLGCRDYAILMISIMKYRGIPARARYGHATYIIPDFHTSHVICEVWNEAENRWMLVDPYFVMIDFSRDQFDFSNEAWLKLQEKQIDPGLFGIPGKYSGLISIAAKVTGDLASLLGSEYSVFQYAPMLDYAFKNDYQLSPEHTDLLNRTSELMTSLDAEHISRLKEIYDNHPQIQITRSFADNSIRSAQHQSAAADRPGNNVKD